MSVTRYRQVAGSALVGTSAYYLNNNWDEAQELVKAGLKRIRKYAKDEYYPGKRVKMPFQNPDQAPSGRAYDQGEGYHERPGKKPGKLPPNNLSMARNPEKMLTTRSAMVVKGKTKQKKTKKIRVSPYLRKAIKQVSKGAAAFGTYTKVYAGFVGNIVNPLTFTSTTIGDFGRVITSVQIPASGAIPFRTLFNCLVKFASGAAPVPVDGSGMNYFTPGKILDAASILFNSKLPSNVPYGPNGNLSTTMSLVGVPSNTNAGHLKIEVIKSYVSFTIKNVGQRVLTMDIWECTPTVKFAQNSALQDVVGAFESLSDATLDQNFAYYNGETTAALATHGEHEIKYDPLAVAKQLFHIKWTWKKRSMVLAPQETCVHSINGPKGVMDYAKLNQWDKTGAGVPVQTDNSNAIYKGFGVSVVIACNGDQVIPTTVTSTAGGRKHYYDGSTQRLGAPVAIEVEEAFTIRVPEIAGFTSNDTLAGGQQLLNMRKRKDVFWNACESGNGAYGITNELTPTAIGTLATGIQYT